MIGRRLPAVRPGPAPLAEIMRLLSPVMGFEGVAWYVQVWFTGDVLLTRLWLDNFVDRLVLKDGD